LAFLSIIGLSGEARQYFAERMLPQSEAKLNHFAAEVLGVMPTWATIPCDPPFVRSEYSPSNFDEVMVQYGEYCAWLIAKQEELTPVIEGRQVVDVTSFAQSSLFPLVADIKFEEGYLRRLLEEYNFSLVELQNFKSESNKSEIEVIIIFFAPVVLAIALALRLTKVSGEIWWYRRRKISDK
jgi:hypothetical protein